MAVLMNVVLEQKSNNSTSDLRLLHPSVLFPFVINSKWHYSGVYEREKNQIQRSSGHWTVF